MASAAYFVGWPDELAESSPYEPDRHPKDCAPDYLRVGAESKTMKAVAAKATGPQVRVAFTCPERNSALLNCREPGSYLGAGCLRASVGQ